MSLTSTTPGMCLGGVWTLMAWLVISSDHTSIVPNTTCHGGWRMNDATDDDNDDEHLETVEEVVPDDDDGAAARGPALAGGDGLDAGDGRGGVEAGVES